MNMSTELRRWRYEHGDSSSGPFEAAARELDRLYAENERLREALRWYANNPNHVYLDAGHRARKALDSAGETIEESR